MQELRVGTRPITLDDDGHLVDFDQWSPEVARVLAEQEGLGELTEDHLSVLTYIRGYYTKYGVAPMLTMLARECGKTYRELHAMFLKQPGKRAARLAGLSKTTGCV